LFDWASQPFFTLVSTFVFAPYFASALAANPAQGQALWGYATAAAGLALGVLSPMLGSVADAGGAKKPWIAGSSTVLALACAALWFAAPGTPGAILLALIAFAVATIAAEIAAVFNNAMMSHLVPPERLGRLSGAGWAAGYAGGLVSLILVLGLLVASPETGRTYLGFEPLIGGAPGSRTGDRATGPLSALWLLVFLLPLFVLTPDAPRSGLKLGAAVQEGLARLKGTVGEAQSQPALLRFLVANMVYQDGLVALFAFGGIYGAGVFGWGPLELGLFGIGLTVTGTLGALAGGVLDDRVGARAVILGGLAALVAVCLGILSLGREHVLFVVATAPKTAGSGPFSTAPEQAYLALGLVIGAVAGPIQAASRSFLGRLVPPSEAGRYFGLLALSGKVTSFLAPLAVALATSATGRQEAGLAVLVAFFALGALLLAGVAPRPGFAREAG
jgi:UMF1 family MFS transporter